MGETDERRLNPPSGHQFPAVRTQAVDTGGIGPGSSVQRDDEADSAAHGGAFRTAGARLDRERLGEARGRVGVEPASVGQKIGASLCGDPRLGSLGFVPARSELGHTVGREADMADEQLLHGLLSIVPSVRTAVWFLTSRDKRKGGAFSPARR